MELLDVIIESERLIIKPVSSEHAEDIFKEFDEEITKYMCPAPPKVIDDTLEYINDSYKKMKAKTNLHCVAISSKTKEFIGCAGVHKIDTKRPELGLWIKKTQHNKGYGKEIIKALISWTNENYQVEYFIYPVDKRNVPSTKIPVSLGGSVQSAYKQKNESNRILDINVYHIPAL